jgi:hypothetical protein
VIRTLLFLPRGCASFPFQIDAAFTLALLAVGRRLCSAVRVERLRRAEGCRLVIAIEDLPQAPPSLLPQPLVAKLVA